MVKHPYYPPGSSELESAVTEADQLLAAYSEEQWLQLVPKQAPRGALNEPFDGSKGWVWSPETPDQIMTRNGLVFPNEAYPYHYASVKVMSGKTVEVPYVDYNGKMMLIQARIDYEKDLFMTRKLPVLANAYVATGDETYARRAALALDAWASVVPDYYMTGKNKAVLISADDVAAYYETDIQRASDHNGIAHEIHTGEIVAFDRIYDSEALKELSAEKGCDVRAHIQNNLFLNIVDWLIHYQSMNVHTATNLSGAVDGIVRVATVTAKSEYMEWMDRYMDITVGQNFKRDGMFPESFSYHSGYARTNLGIARLVAHYFKIHGAETELLQALQKKIEWQVRFLEKANDAQKIVSFPDGDMPPFDDTTKGGAAPRTATGSQLLPAYGHLMLGDGTGDNQVQFNLHFNDKGNHVHPNVMSATLYGFGKELLGGIRYSRIPSRDFSRSTISTNTVVVDQVNQYRGNNQLQGNPGHLFTEGILTLFEPGLDGIQASEVYSKWAYPGTVSRYQRLNILNTSDPKHPYLIDLFKVTGGAVHEYFLHGSTQFDQIVETALPLTKINKPYPLLPDHESWTDPVKDGADANWYGMLRDMSTGRSDGKWDVSFRDAANGGIGTRIFMLDDGTNQVYVGKSPYSYREKVYDDIYQFWRPSLMVKREQPVSGDLDSLFIGVIEPLNGESDIDQVERLPLRGEHSEHMALSIRFKSGREDIILVNLNHTDITGNTAADTPFTTEDGYYTLNGRIGIVSKNNGTQKAYLLNGSTFQYGNETLPSDQPSITGTLSGAVRTVDGSDVNAFITDADIPQSDSLNGKWISLQFGSYQVVPDSSGKYPMGIQEQTGISEWFQIDHIEQRDGKTWMILTDDHALSMRNGHTVEQLRPHRTFKGTPSFRLDWSTTK